MNSEFTTADIVLNDMQLMIQLKALMWEASRSIMEIYNSKDFGTEAKNDESPVTKADLAAHRVLVQGLSELTPLIPVVSEEDPDSVDIGRTANTYWLIDPLDGTKEFINRNGEFTCNLALIENKKAVLGFVTTPAHDELYVGGPALDSTIETRQTPPQVIKHSRVDDVTRVVASKSHLNKETQKYIEAIEGNIDLVQAGSSFKFLKIATGDADVYPRLAPTCEWDTAAAHAILVGAGGKVIQANGEPMVYGKNDILNPHFVASAIS